MQKLIVSGKIISFDEENRLIEVLYKNRINRYYFQRSLLNIIGKYLEIGRFIQFAVYDEKRKYKDYQVYTVEYVRKICMIRYRKNISYYDYKHIRHGTKELVNELKNIMFLDLEMSMHPYHRDKNFTQEIIQVGIHLIDQNNNVLLKYIKNIKPTLHPKLTKRTLKFLQLSQEDVDQGISFKEFYYDFKEIVERYNPAIIVWGRNDFLALRQGYAANNLPTLKAKTRYINLLKLHKNYFNLKNDLGLFNALRLYTEAPPIQEHNAYEDAYVTSQIFQGFKAVLNRELEVDIFSVLPGGMK